MCDRRKEKEMYRKKYTSMFIAKKDQSNKTKTETQREERRKHCKFVRQCCNDIDCNRGVILSVSEAETDPNGSARIKRTAKEKFP